MSQEYFSREFREISIKGQAVNVRITVHVEEDETDYEYGDIHPRPKAGHFYATVRVDAEALGETGCDALGACSLPVNGVYTQEVFNKAVRETVFENEMVTEALNNLRDNVVSRANLLKPFAD